MNYRDESAYRKLNALDVRHHAPTNREALHLYSDYVKPVYMVDGTGYNMDEHGQSQTVKPMFSGKSRASIGIVDPYFRQWNVGDLPSKQSLQGRDVKPGVRVGTSPARSDEVAKSDAAHGGRRTRNLLQSNLFMRPPSGVTMRQPSPFRVQPSAEKTSQADSSPISRAESRSMQLSDQRSGASSHSNMNGWTTRDARSSQVLQHVSVIKGVSNQSAGSFKERPLSIPTTPVLRAISNSPSLNASAMPRSLDMRSPDMTGAQQGRYNYCHSSQSHLRKNIDRITTPSPEMFSIGVGQDRSYTFGNRGSVKHTDFGTAKDQANHTQAINRSIEDDQDVLEVRKLPSHAGISSMQNVTREENIKKTSVARSKLKKNSEYLPSPPSSVSSQPVQLYQHRGDIAKSDSKPNLPDIRRPGPVVENNNNNGTHAHKSAHILQWQHSESSHTGNDSKNAQQLTENQLHERLLKLAIGNKDESAAKSTVVDLPIKREYNTGGDASPSTTAASSQRLLLGDNNTRNSYSGESSVTSNISNKLISNIKLVNTVLTQHLVPVPVIMDQSKLTSMKNIQAERISDLAKKLMQETSKSLQQPVVPGRIFGPAKILIPTSGQTGPKVPNLARSLPGVPPSKSSDVALARSDRSSRSPRVINTGSIDGLKDDQGSFSSADEFEDLP